jgi:ferredoxin
MPGLDEASTEDLQRLLRGTQSREATRRLMVAIAYKEGTSMATLADWYDLPLVTVEEWFNQFREDPVEDVVAKLERFEMPGRDVTPRARSAPSTVEYLNYEVLDDHGWAHDDEDLFEKAAEADLTPQDYGRVLVEAQQSILDAVEDRNLSWPYACRGGACSNCAVLVREGEIAMPGNQILDEESLERGARLACVGAPATAEVKLLFNVKHLPFLDELRLPADRFE